LRALLAGVILAALAATTAAALAPARAAVAKSPRARPTQAPRSAAQDVALRWYDITDQTVTAAAFAEPVTQSRTWAVGWLAAARAVGNSTEPSYSIAAFAQALHDTLAEQVPGQRSQLDSDLASTLAGIPDGSAKSSGIAAGRREAAATLSQRSGDGLDTASVDASYTPPPPAPGVWQPTPPTYGPALRAGQGNAHTFLLARNNQFDPGAPPSLSSRTYLDALAEVRAYGSATSSVRTPHQTDVAKFWEPAANIQYVQVVRAALADTRHPLAWESRFVAAFQVITTDAQIADYNAKFEYVFWRPVTAVRNGSVNPDPNWTPFFTTPRYPEYPSGHTGYAGAAQSVLTAFLGPNAPAPISVTSPTDSGATHTYDNWAQITQEVIDARVWEGIHFRFSDNVGDQLGELVAGYDLNRLGALGL
jgi:hypothetical protein